MMIGFRDRQFHANQHPFQNPWRACQLGSGDVDCRHARATANHGADLVGIFHRIPTRTSFGETDRHGSSHDERRHGSGMAAGGWTLKLVAQRTST